MADLSKNPWHDLNSSISSVKLGLSLLREEMKPFIQNNNEIDAICSQIDQKINLSIEQISNLRKKFGDT